jgi:PAS domain S-box-containing protein
MVLGILAAVLWTVNPLGLVLLSVPVAMSYAAYRERVESVKDRDDWRSLYEAGRFLAGPLGEADDFQPFVRTLETLLRAEAVELIVVDQHHVTVHGSSRKQSFTVIEGDPHAVERHVSVRPGIEPQIALIGGPDDVNGVIAVHRQEPLDDRDRALLDDLAAQIAIRLRNHRVFAETLEQARLADIIGHTSDGVFTVTPDGRIGAWNPAMERITGRDRDDAIGRSPAEVLGARCAEVLFDDLPAAEAEKQPVEALVDCSDGEPRCVILRSCSISDQERAARSRVVVVHDVTADLQAEQLKHDFVSLVSHELRTPLTPLKGFLRSLVDGVVDDSPEARREYYQIMLRQTERLERLIGDLLDVSQIETGNLLIDAQPVELGLLVLRQVAEYERQHPGRIVFHDPRSPLPVQADPVRVEQVLSNLISNALKYSPPDRPIDVRVTIDRDQAVVAVEDRGPGIAHADQERIFERFYRVDAAARSRVKGVGLGLFIAHSLAEAMGGRLGVTSRLGHGSTFSFALPLSGSAPSEDAVDADVAPVGAAAS